MRSEFQPPGYLTIVQSEASPVLDGVQALPDAFAQSEDYEAFSSVAETQHVETLWLRRQGEGTDDFFIDYAWRRNMQYDRQGYLIVILFTDCSVRIVGRGLHPLMMKLRNKKVEWIEEHDPQRWPEPAPEEPLVSEITVEFFTSRE